MTRYRGWHYLPFIDITVWQSSWAMTGWQRQELWMPCLLGGVWMTFTKYILKIYLEFSWFMPSREDSFLHLTSIYRVPVKYQMRVQEGICSYDTYILALKDSQQANRPVVRYQRMRCCEQEDEWFKLGGQVKPTEKVWTRTWVTRKSQSYNDLRVEGTAWARALQCVLETDKKVSIVEVWYVRGAKDKTWEDLRLSLTSLNFILSAIGGLPWRHIG